MVGSFRDSAVSAAHHVFRDGRARSDIDDEDPLSRPIMGVGSEKSSAVVSPLRFIRALVDQGVRDEHDLSLRKRIRLTNALCLFGAFVMFASLPFDRVTAPRWMLAEDILGGLAYLGLLLANRAGLFTTSRLVCLALSNAIVLGNAVLLGRDSGASMVFIALASMPFALFDLRNRAAIALGVALALAGFVLAESDLLMAYRSLSENYSPAAYHIYSATVTLVGLLFVLIQTARANARAERELRENRQAAIYSAKMAALGEMSGNIAHEVNNPLMAIQLRAQRLLRMAESGRLDLEAAVKVGRDIQGTVERIARIVDALRSFARDVEKDPLRAESVRAIVKDTIELCAERFREHQIALEVEPIPEDLLVECRNVQISQILLNLLSNAHDAVENQPTRWVRISTDAPAKDEVCIAVTDSGPGIPAPLQPRIMEPFFTTKEIGKGTGLGLSVSKGIAEAHGGRLAYDAGAPHTRFVLTLRRSALTA
jgi:signal transduction histidine kinase